MKKIALVTGASAGIGKETARHLAAHGYKVYAAARRIDKMADLMPLGIKSIALDVTDDASMMSCVNAVVEAEGQIDILINNAGFGSYGAIEEVSMETAKYQMEVNLFGAARMIQLVLPYMRQQKWGKIVNISSIGGKLAGPFGGWYHASKFAMEGLSDSLRNEVKPFGIDVIVIEPGGIKSEWAGIAQDSMLKTSGEGVYGSVVHRFIKAHTKLEKKNPGPELISALILKAVEADSPKTRYHAGYLAGPALFLRKVLSDKMFDKITMSAIK
ncbi:NAD(P)-dependent dehydrogenase (short-subunit alcohol dehydrogenase family) [Pedobacter sp. UYP30]|uniref:oxidoreductase n=1 Tax=Pedobacter sp. UYP30 TaxID=1756400 RepID=UPI003396CAC9